MSSQADTTTSKRPNPYPLSNPRTKGKRTHTSTQHTTTNHPKRDLRADPPVHKRHSSTESTAHTFQRTTSNDHKSPITPTTSFPPPPTHRSPKTTGAQAKRCSAYPTSSTQRRTTPTAWAPPLRTQKTRRDSHVRTTGVGGHPDRPKGEETTQAKGRSTCI